ncbi:MAG: hypothetical protein HQL32_09645 [Planctomycetes bacterium]|nr:hypothetical protein [Planctomycetota bacterium]
MNKATLTESYYCQTEDLLQRLNLDSLLDLNLFLGSLGYQELNGEDEWQPTVKGRGLCCWHRTGQIRPNGYEEFEILWHSSLLDEIKKEMVLS